MMMDLLSEIARLKKELDENVDPNQKGKINVNLNFNGTTNINKDGKDKNIVDNIGKTINIVSNGVKIGKVIGTIATATAPLWLPAIGNSLKNKIAIDNNGSLFISNSNDKKTESYYKTNTDLNGKFVMTYENKNNSPLTNYLLSKNIDLSSGEKCFKFLTPNEFTNFFVPYLKRKNNVIKYTETNIRKISETKFENMVVTFLLFKNDKKEFCFKISSLCAAMIMDYEEQNSPGAVEVIPEIIINKK